VLETFEKELAGGKTRPAAFAQTEQALENLAKSDRRYRNIMFGILEVMGATYATLATVGLIWPSGGDNKLQPSGATILYGSAALTMGLGFALRYAELPTERLLKLYRTDPDLQIGLGVVPTPSGGMVGLSGRF
jgi:hypothetical protein